MSFIVFKKSQLIDLSFSKQRDVILVNENGSYFSTSLSTCNTRKYHGIFATPQPEIDDQLHVLLSTIDATVLANNNTYPLDTHQYPNNHFPLGYLSLDEFTFQQIPKWTNKTEDITLDKEILICKKENRVLIKYKIIKVNEPAKIHFHPFLACRNIHSLRKSELDLKSRFESIENGIKFSTYNDYSPLFIQFSKSNEYVSAPDWNYDIEYFREQERGYEYQETLNVPGYFEVIIKQGDELVLSIGLSEIKTKTLLTRFNKEMHLYTKLIDYKSCLVNSAEQFIVKQLKHTNVVAGWHWFGTWGRDTFIALPGLTLATNHPNKFREIVASMLTDLKDGLFPNMGKSYNTADASLWFFWSLQQYAVHTKSLPKIWEEYGTSMKSILENYKKGTLHNIKMNKNGLLYAGEPGIAVTWMDAIVDGKPVTPRIGFTVELNALWYNAIQFALETAAFSKDDDFINYWKPLPAQIEKSFKDTFWDEQKGYLADYVDDMHMDWAIRPNQIFAASLPYSPIDSAIRRSVVDTVEDKLLTPYGLRTLSTDDPKYKGRYQGDHKSRDLAYHQGTVWPWLLGHFSDAYFKVYGNDGIDLISTIYNNFNPEHSHFEYGIGSIAEIYDGDHPQHPNGAITQAWSVAELLRTEQILQQYKSSGTNKGTESLKNEIGYQIT